MLFRSRIQKPSERETAFAFPSLDGAELVSRWDMQITPPDILITNISMLNAMLSRSSEQTMLALTRDWLASDRRNRFTLVIDELHLQRGSEGTELIYLLRLLLVRLGLDDPDRHQQFRLLSSSASLPADGESAENSLDFLRDAFADFGLPLGSGREAWRQAIVSGEVVPPCEPAGAWRLPADPAVVLAACEAFSASDLAPTDSDALLTQASLNGSSLGPPHTALLDALMVPGKEASARWLLLARGLGSALERACSDPEPRATALRTIAHRLWPTHGWSDLQIEQVLRLLCGITGCVGEGPAGRDAGLPRFRLHTFFKNPEGLFATVLPPAQRSAEAPGRWQGPLSLNPSGRLLDIAADGSSEQRRQFELLHCECCGETFLGGVRARQRPLDPSEPERMELLPHEADTEQLPDQPLAQRFEQLSYDDYAILWPVDDNSAAQKDPDNQESWQPVWLDVASGVVLRSGSADPALQPAYLFHRDTDKAVHGFASSDPTSHRP